MIGKPSASGRGRDSEGLPPEPRRIAVLHLDSLCCLPALDTLFHGLGSRVGLVLSSERVSDPGDLWRQFRSGASNWGIPMTLALGFDVVALRVAAAIAPPLRRLRPRWLAPKSGDTVCQPLLTLREHASRVGARFESVGDINGKPAIALMREFRPDLVVSFHFDQILGEAALDAAACPVVNIHPSLLPLRRGPCPAFWTLADADTRWGVTVHVVDIRIDAGPVLARRERRALPGLSMTELDDQLFRDGARLLLDLLDEKSTAVADPAGQPGTYQTFPDAGAVRAARRRGVKLWRMAHAAQLLGALNGWTGSRPAASNGNP